MGIVSKFHTRKLQLILRGYRLRQIRVKRRRENGYDEEDEEDDDDDGSEYSPSELSAAIAAEGRDIEEENDDLDSVRTCFAIMARNVIKYSSIISFT